VSEGVFVTDSELQVSCLLWTHSYTAFIARGKHGYLLSTFRRCLQRGTTDSFTEVWVISIR